MNVHKGFEAAVIALETICSGLVELRSKLHYEVALCEMKKDTLAKVKRCLFLPSPCPFHHSLLTSHL